MTRRQETNEARQAARELLAVLVAIVDKHGLESDFTRAEWERKYPWLRPGADELFQEAIDGLARHAIAEHKAGRTRPLREFAKESGIDLGEEGEG